MKYNETLLENKAFNFFRQLMYNLAVAICVMLLITLFCVYGLKYQLYEIKSDSQYPVFKTGDMVVVKAQSEYKVGDILKYETSIPVTHRLIAIMTDSSTGTTYYLCHGDNVQSAISQADYEAKYGVGTYPEDERVSWEIDSEYIYDLIAQNKTLTEIVGSSSGSGSSSARNIQAIKLNQIQGKVEAKVANYGTYINIIKEHYMLFIALIAGIWCICTLVQNEGEINKARRLL